jgi:hypothetical protein
LSCAITTDKRLRMSILKTSHVGEPRSHDVKKKAALGGLKVSFSSDTSDDDGSGEDSRRSSDDGSHSGDDGSRSGHKDSGSTALVDILQLADHFEPWLSWLRPPTRPPLDRSVLILS